MHILGFVGYAIHVATVELCCCSIEAAVDSMEMNVLTLNVLCSSKTLQKQAVGRPIPTCRHLPSSDLDDGKERVHDYCQINSVLP